MKWRFISPFAAYIILEILLWSFFTLRSDKVIRLRLINIKSRYQAERRKSVLFQFSSIVIHVFRLGRGLYILEVLRVGLVDVEKLRDVTWWKEKNSVSDSCFYSSSQSKKLYSVVKLRKQSITFHSDFTFVENISPVCPYSTEQRKKSKMMIKVHDFVNLEKESKTYLTVKEEETKILHEIWKNSLKQKRWRLNND